MKNLKLRGRIIEHFGTQEDFAIQSKIGESIISKIVRRKRKPTEGQMKIISKMLKLKPKEIWAE